MKRNTITYLAQEILIIENDRILSIPYSEIKAIICDKPYINVETIEKKYQLAQNLTGFCKELPTYIIQCNKSTYINLLHVTSILKTKSGYEAQLKGTSYPIARRRIADIKENFIEIKERTEQRTCHDCNNCKNNRLAHHS